MLRECYQNPVFHALLTMRKTDAAIIHAMGRTPAAAGTIYIVLPFAASSARYAARADQNLICMRSVNILSS